MTTLLYHRDPLLLSFDATVVAVDGDGVILDETAFYPEAGGQMADRGALVVGGRRLAVVDVQVDDDGTVRHALEAVPLEGLEAGARVHGEIDRARRRQFMALHTAQHMLSRALIEEANAETVSARLGESVCTVDVDVAALSEAALAKAEALVNSVVDDDVAVRAWFPSEDELRALPLRRRPKVAENIRVVAIGAPDDPTAPLDPAQAFDLSPCGGTHCLRTAQIGLVRVVGLERYKGKMRVSFQAGPRARAEVFERARVLEGLAHELSSSPTDVPAALERLRAQVKAARDDRSTVVDRLAAVVAAELAAAGQAAAPRRAAVVDGDVELLRAVSARLAGHHEVDALLACPSADGLHVLLMRAPSSTLDCGALLKKIASAAGGKGGGRPERAEGRVPAGADFVALVDAALS